MIAEPYICIKGPKAGEIESVEYSTPPSNKVTPSYGDGCQWMSYADFEREKLRELGHRCFSLVTDGGYVISLEKKDYSSGNLIDFYYAQYIASSESSRLLKRAEFLKAVCEREGVRW